MMSPLTDEVDLGNIVQLLGIT